MVWSGLLEHGIVASNHIFQRRVLRSVNISIAYSSKQMKEVKFWLFASINDFIFIGNDEHMIIDFKTSMLHEFDMTDLGRMQYFLGIEVFQKQEGIFIHQRKYAHEVLYIGLMWISAILCLIQLYLDSNFCKIQLKKIRQQSLQANCRYFNVFNYHSTWYYVSSKSNI